MGMIESINKEHWLKISVKEIREATNLLLLDQIPKTT